MPSNPLATINCTGRRRGRCRLRRRVVLGCGPAPPGATSTGRARHGGGDGSAGSRGLCGGWRGWVGTRQLWSSSATSCRPPRPFADCLSRPGERRGPGARGVPVGASAGEHHARWRARRFARKGLYNSRIDQHPFCHWVCRQPCASHDLHRAALRLPCRQLDRHAAPRPGCTVGVTTALPEGPSGLRLGRRRAGPVEVDNPGDVLHKQL